MATKKIIELIDDVDGTVIDGAGGTVPFALDGVEYEIDLTEDNKKKLYDTFNPYIVRGRKTSRPSLGKPAKRDKAQLEKIREWARENGYTVSPRGRIPEAVEKAYHENAGRPVQAPKATKTRTTRKTAAAKSA